VLVSPLPSSAKLLEEGSVASLQEFQRQTLQLKRQKELAEALLEDERIAEKNKARQAAGTWTRLVAGKGKAQQNVSKSVGVGGDETKPFQKPPNAYELYAAIDRKDLA
jgi:hypothetical protein